MQNNKVLFIANITKHILRFHLPYLKWFQTNGYETHVAANGDEDIPYCDVKYNIPIDRSPFSIRNIYAHQRLKRIINDNHFVLVHGHTPMGGVLARTASMESRKKGTIVFYTSHGFHFYKGAPIKNWLLYYPVEKYLSRYTDAIITINSEDYDLIVRNKFKSEGLYKINGIGVNNSKLKRISVGEKNILRKSKGYAEEDFILIYMAEFIHRKNHKFILDSVKTIKQRIPRLKILFAGRGELLEPMKQYAKEIHVEEIVDFLGFRSDIDQLLAISDIGISSSRQEGLGINIAEEMFCGLPVVATVDRGHKEMIEHCVNGFLFEQNNHAQFAQYIFKLFDDKKFRSECGDRAFNSIQKFSIENSLRSMAEIYQKYL